MKRLNFLAPLLAFSIALASCTGDDGEPGPKGDTGDTGAAGADGIGIQKNGFFEGTASGIRTDGTAFSEAFKFEYSESLLQGFEDNTIDILKDDNSESYFSVYDLELSGNSLVVSNTTYLYFKLVKELNATDLFVLRARPYFSDKEGYVLELSEAQNATYRFQQRADGLYYNESGYFDGTDYIDAYVFETSGSPYYSFYYNQTNGNLLVVRDNSNGDEFTSGPVFDLYNTLVFKNNPSIGSYTFYNKATNTSLHTVVPEVLADTFTVTNYVQNATTGIVTFDYVLKISQYRSKTDSYNNGQNSTGHDLTITGSFNSGNKVYKNVFSRIATGG
jgi:hypothetical protein